MQQDIKPMQYGFRRMKGRLTLPGLNRRFRGVPDGMLAETTAELAALQQQDREEHPHKVVFEFPVLNSKPLGPKSSLRVQGLAA